MPQAYNPIIVALDVDSAERAIGLADRVSASVGAVKVGSQLFTAAGPDVVRRLVERGHRVFLDLKYHDIPNTVAGAVAEAARLGAWMIDVHAAGGEAMMRTARDAAVKAASVAGRPAPLVIAVTVLTSLDQAALVSIGVGRPVLHQVEALARLARQAGLDGVVASPLEVARLRRICGPAFTLVTPGIRAESPTEGHRDDQARTLSAPATLAAGASYLVVGRPIVAAPDPGAAARAMAASLGIECGAPSGAAG
ncbi:MAG: orotidine-5'-phosphate decarboxylase [Acidobacteriota bacterium]